MVAARTGIRLAGRGAWQRYFSCFAVLVLLAQLMLAANHIHLPGAHGEHGAEAAATTPRKTDGTPPGPSHRDDAFCPLCWAQAAASSLLMSPAIELRVPATIAAAPIVPVLHRLADPFAPNGFRPRAPPQSVLA